jgi:hypothetical protein
MSIPHIKSGEVVELPLGPALGSARTTTLVKTTDLELIRLIIPAGKVIPLHKAPGENHSWHAPSNEVFPGISFESSIIRNLSVG